jgi:hypothetical protein
MLARHPRARACGNKETRASAGRGAGLLFVPRQRAQRGVEGEPGEVSQWVRSGISEGAEETSANQNFSKTGLPEYMFTLALMRLILV